MNLETIIKNEIAARGFLNLHDFMQMALYHPEYGYYIKQSPLGVKGDFITSPEISQLFGEAIAVYLLSAIEQNFSGQKLNLVELGAGRGTLMADLLRIFAKFPSLFTNIDVFIIEVNQPLKTAQQQLLKNSPFNITWIDSINEVPQNPTIIYANELFDCFPVQQFTFTNGKWHQNGLILEGDSIKQTSQLNEPFAKALIPSSVTPFEGAVYELSPMVEAESAKLFHHVKTNKGIFLTFDYGYFTSNLKDTIQSLYRHKFNPLLENIGHADITAYVDFALLERIARKNGLQALSLSTQRDFLISCGIELRAEKLSESKAQPIKDEIKTSLDRLIGENQMGNIFKVLALIEI